METANYPKDILKVDNINEKASNFAKNILFWLLIYPFSG
jgi:hypothetical protein